MLTAHRNLLLSPKATDEQRQLKNRTAIRRPSAKRQLISALQSKNAVKDLAALPAREESLHVVICRGNFPLWQIVPATLRMATPAVIDALHIATLSFNEQNTTEMLDLFDDGKIRAVTMVASIFFERQCPKQYQSMAQGLQARGQRIVAPRNHAKIIAMAMSDGRRFVVESSANLRSCCNIEQFTLTESPDLHEFHRNWIEQVTSAALGGK